MSSTEPAPEPDEPNKEQNPHAFSAADQNSVVPLAWKPTPREPVPVVRCTQIKKDGVRCGRWSIRGYHKCIKHAGPGALMPDGNVNVYAEKIIEAARLRLIDSTDMALDVLENLWSSPGTADAIKMKAATEVLDRAGIRGGFDIKVEGEITASPSDELAKRLKKLRDGAEAVAKMKEEREQALIFDAEIVEDDDQPTLFELDEAEESTDEQ